AWTDAGGADHAIELRGWAQSDPNNSGTWQLSGTARVDTGGSANSSPPGTFAGTLVFAPNGTQAGMKGVVTAAAPPASACSDPSS
ncbi:MAG TPA: hypothetical protein VNY84_03035, partial [Acidimicrobiales bacterium]|nr:hypothetical protein [Acidimicrobiales bacterium]